MQESFHLHLFRQINFPLPATMKASILQRNVVIMILTLQSYVHQTRHTLRKWLLNPQWQRVLHAAARIFAGFCLSAASLGHSPQPFAMGLILACSGWAAVLTGLGSALGYFLFWGQQGLLCLLWTIFAVPVALLLSDRTTVQQTPPLLPAIGMLIVSASGVLARSLWLVPGPELSIFLLQAFLGGGSTWLFRDALKTRSAVSQWLTWSVAVLALAQIAPFLWMNFGFLTASALTISGAFPVAALSGLALDLAQITPVPMTAVLTLGYLLRFLPGSRKVLRCLIPGVGYLLIMRLCGYWELMPIPSLVLGALSGLYLPTIAAEPRRRGETGILQVRLELVSGVLAQSEQLLEQLEDSPIDEASLICRAAELACSGCPCRKNCKDFRSLSQIPPQILHRPLLTPSELPVVCRKSGRFLIELHRAQERLRTIQASRTHQSECRAALIQQYRFLADYLQELSDSLSRRNVPTTICYTPEVFVFGNRPEADNGDRCLRFPGIEGAYYVLLCDGMGTGPGAVAESRSAGTLLKKLLSAGFPASHALRSLNSLCALRDQAGAATIDLVRLDLCTGTAVLYKWGAAPSYLLTPSGTQKVGTTAPPPGLSVVGTQECREQVTLRRGEQLILASDGIDESAALRCCADQHGASPSYLATELLGHADRDDATVILLQLKPKAKNEKVLS